MVRCSNCQHIFVVYPVPEDTAVEPQRGNQGRSHLGNPVDPSGPAADNFKKPVLANRSLNSEKKPAGGFRDPEQVPKSILDDLLGMQKTANPREGTLGKNNNRNNGPVPATDDCGSAAPDSGGEETQYADLPDLADIENSIDWSGIREANEA
jgi:hypothetical protein